MEQFTTYRAKGKEIGLVFLFKYDLKGNLKLFEIAEGELNSGQIKWLFTGYLPSDATYEDVKDLLSKLKTNFPADESIMRTVWMKDKKYLKVFEIEKSSADLTFEALWNLYDYKVKRVECEKQFNKLKEADIIKLFLSVPKYKDYLQRKRIAQAHLSTFINQRYFEDDWSKA
jgi:hypothetical protein